MADFTNNWLGILIGFVVAISILGCAVLLLAQSKMKVKVGADGKPLPVETTGHVWDGDLRENNNPLPGWWMKLFYGTIIFAVVYLLLYGGFGSFKGYLGWSQTDEYKAELQAGDAQYGPLFQKYMAMDIPTVAKDPQALEIGERLFLNTCAQCHGSDAQGSRLSNLTIVTGYTVVIHNHHGHTARWPQRLPPMADAAAMQTMIECRPLCSACPALPTMQQANCAKFAAAPYATASIWNH
jgi:mono/diheme cytochrome c family protein